MAIRRRITQPNQTGLFSDVSDSLRTRLQSLDLEEEQALKVLDGIRQKKEAYARLLELEGSESKTPAQAFIPRLKPSKPKQDVHSLVRDLLLKGIFNKDKIIEAVEDEGHEKPGRSVNAALMTFKRYGHVDPQGADGRDFVLTSTGRDALRREAEGAE